MGPEEFKDVVRRTRTALEENRADDARDLLVAAIELRPGHPGLTRLLAIVEMVAENWESVVDLAGAQLREDPGSVPFLETRAHASALLQDMDQAQRDLIGLIDRLATLAGRDGDAACDPLSQSCRTVDEVSAGAKAALATTYYGLGDLDEAERVAREVLGDRPDWVQARFVLALVANKRDDIDGAMEAYRGILDQFPWCSGCLNNIGVLHYRRHELADAKRSFDAALKVTSVLDRRGAAIVKSNLADLLVLAGKLDAADAKYREAIATSPRFAGAHYGHAQLFDLRGRLREARAMMQHALALDPKGVDRYNSEYIEPEWRGYFEAMVADAEGRFPEARALWEKVAAGSVGMLRGPAMRHL
jgi:tetratricopeptide (TPR) repeat protein